MIFSQPVDHKTVALPETCRKKIFMLSLNQKIRYLVNLQIAKLQLFFFFFFFSPEKSRKKLSCSPLNVVLQNKYDKSVCRFLQISFITQPCTAFPNRLDLFVLFSLHTLGNFQINESRLETQARQVITICIFDKLS